MTITANDFKRLQREVETLKKKVAQLERRRNGERREKPEAIAPRQARKRRFDTIRQAARRNAMTEAEAMSLASKATQASSG